MSIRENVLDLYSQIKNGGTLEGAFDSLNDILSKNSTEIEFTYGLFLKESDFSTKEAIASVLIKYKQTAELIDFLTNKAKWSEEDFTELGIEIN